MGNSNIKERVFASLNERIYEFDHDSGLHVQIIPKKGFKKKFAFLATDFGSVNTEYIDENGKKVAVPCGTAHFLEHKLYEQPDGDVMNQFAALGADCNAATGFSKTFYYFECTQNFEASLDILLRHVFHPYFTKENVEKEKGIIVQEINMYLDDAYYVGSAELLKLLYKVNPVRNDIAGTEESVMSITPEMLYACHDAFYRPNNMCLTVVGDVTTESVQEALQRAKLPTQKGKIIKVYPDEPTEIFGKSSKCIMETSQTLFNFGFKDNPAKYKGIEMVRRKLAGRIAKEVLFGSSSDLYEKLYNSGYINYDFYASYEIEREYGMFTLSGASEKVDIIQEEIKKYIENISKNGVNTKEFTAVRNALHGSSIRAFDALFYLGRAFGQFYLQGMDAFDYLTTCGKITEEEVNDIIKNLLRGEMAISVVEPKGGFDI